MPPLLRAVAATITAVLAAAAPARAERRGDVGLGLAVGGTAASAGLIFWGWRRESVTWTATGVVSLVATPSLGHWYAGDGLTPGLAMRGAGLGVAGLSLFAGMACGAADLDGDRAPRARCPVPVRAGLVVGAALVLAGAALDIVTTPDAVEAANTDAVARHGAPTVILPLYAAAL